MHDLKLTYYTNRWQSTTTLRLEATATGWIFQAPAHRGETNSEGHPHLLGNLNQDNVSFPHGIDGHLSHLWDLIKAGEIDHGRAQEMLNELGQWISDTEQARPRWRGWNC
ncbi:hypothetical protein [Acidovorax sp. Root217]|uniref:hypothetical protein n=1 Tax=Acidovorax sp. Root217 TaxID=1736492 RepID=UPI00070B5678|nr:hypothetical protein [Acidovorax sp. Root217]KRC30701.1 hypothetical protein ASE31_00525 [Acidovorax sp. Root217]